MARMLPPHVPEATPSAAERKLFARLQAELGESWTVLHSIGLARHRRKPWAEIDFVLVGPTGIFCLEVKGGRVARTNGIWEFTDRNGRTSRKAEGPIRPGGSATPQLRNFLVDAVPEVHAFTVGYGVVVPDITFTVSGPDIEAELVCDERDAVQPFDAYVARIAAYWRRGIRTAGPCRHMSGRG